MPNKQTEQELKLAENLDDLIEKFGYSLEPIQIIQAFKEAGWVSPEYLKEFGRTVHYAAKVGWVKLSEDQNLPEIPDFQYDKIRDRELLRRGAINYSKMLSRWRKVER